MSVDLIIKSATQTVEDFALECELTWTIGQVKEKLTNLYPNNPKKEHQKLIYGGKLLPDHLPLKSVLNHSQDRHIMHLVCPSPAKVSTPKQESKENISTVPPPPPLTVPPSNSTFTQPIFNPSNISTIPGINVAPLNTTDAFQQYLAMQQMYAQFMSHYMSQYTNGVPPVTPYGPVLQDPPVQPPQVPAPPQNAAPNVPPRPAEEEEHDYIDYLYIFSRALILFAALYYYSSLARVLLVVSMFLIISVYVKVNREQQQQQQRQEQQRRETEQTPERQNAADSQTPADIQPTETQEAVPTTSSSETAALAQEPERWNLSTAVSTTCTLVCAFFTSLIPSDPVPVNVN